MPRKVKLPLVSEEMRRRSALLAEEVGRWPGVSTRPMFGMRGLFRDGVIFAMLPEKRSLEDADAIAYKRNGKWVSQVVEGELRLGAAIALLARAFDEAK